MLTDLESALIALAAVFGLALVTIIVIWATRSRGGDAELQSLREERIENERSARTAALEASQAVASASAKRREVRHTRRRIQAAQREEEWDNILDGLEPPTGLAGGAEEDIPQVPQIPA